MSGHCDRTGEIRCGREKACSRPSLGVRRPTSFREERVSTARAVSRARPARAGRARETALAVDTRSSRKLVGLLTPRLGRLHAFSRPHRISPVRSQWPDNSRPRFPASPARAQPSSAGDEGKSPEHSGGAVPESHRSSLFAGRSQLRAAGHQIRWRSLSVVPSLSSCAGCDTTIRTDSHGTCAGVKPCRLRGRSA